MESLDNILSEREAAPVQVQEKEQVTQAATEEGKPEAEQMTEGKSEEGNGGQKMVPHEALHAEKQKVKRYTEEVVDLRKSNETLQRQVAEVLQRIPVPQKEAPQRTDFFADPEAAFNERLQASLGQAIGPVQRQLMFNARLVAGSIHGKDKTEEAIVAFDQAVKDGQVDRSVVQKVFSSGNPFHEAVQWHQHKLAQAEIGDDLVAYKTKLEAEIREKVLAEVSGGSPPVQGQRPAPVMPSNHAAARNVGSRSGPAWAGPTALADIFK